MHPLSITQAFVLGLLAAMPLATALTIDTVAIEVDKRHVVSQILPCSGNYNDLSRSLPQLGLTCIVCVEYGQSCNSWA
jgi:hypothetical protein